MGDIKSGRKMNFSFLAVFFRIESFFSPLASLNHENRYFIHESESVSVFFEGGVFLKSVNWFLTPHLPSQSVNLPIYQVSQQFSDVCCQQVCPD